MIYNNKIEICRPETEVRVNLTLLFSQIRINNCIVKKSMLD